MSDADFKAAFEAHLAAVAKYNTAQRAALLNAFKADLQDELASVGAPQPEASPVAAAAPAAAAAAAPAQAEKAAAGAPVTGAKSSTRVAQGPGGNSSINLGGGGDDRQLTTAHGRKQYGGHSNASSIQLGASADDAKTSVKVHHAPGGGSSISLGDDSAPGASNKPMQRVDRLEAAGASKKPATGRKQIHAAGGESHDVFNQKPDGAGAVHTSVRTHAAPGGKSNLSLAHESAAPAKEAEAPAAAAAGGNDVPASLLKQIIDAVYRKGKVKDTFTKFTGNKGKVLTAAELKDGVQSIGINGFSDAQAVTLIERFAADKKNMNYPEFMKMMAAN